MGVCNNIYLYFLSDIYFTGSKELTNTYPKHKFEAKHKFEVLNNKNNSNITGIHATKQIGESQNVYLNSSYVTARKILEEEEQANKFVINIYNELESNIQLYWIDDKSNESVLQGSIAHKTSSDLDATIGHEFYITKDDNEIEIYRFIADNEQTQVHIHNDSVEQYVKNHRQQDNNEKKDDEEEEKQPGVVKPKEIKIINKYDFSLYCYWIDNDNNKEEIFLDKIASNNIQLFNAYPGHEFIVKDINNVVHKQFVVDSGGENVKVKQLVIEFV